ncbi:dienelactone hydrolase family protein [Govanella unica]|uniref:Dienelactone hydrolase family protein n=1 Tax=Govanella unica TaxID=2975056 RepID=A0A9X3TVM6_9PROT|nr:dienelactone hydrolase family protein [Govania unica]MDA5192554.1 dienelactone hydrolase family protein [Govania unica]
MTRDDDVMMVDDLIPALVGADRRQVLKLLGGVPLATLLANPALAAAVARNLETVSIRTHSGREVSASYIAPAEGKARAAVIMIHEWWGLNSQIKAVAADLAAKEGYAVIAVDLFNGAVTDNTEAAMAQVRGVKPEEAQETLAAWLAWAKARGAVKRATLGWCFGGGWSLNASLATPVDATVIYYGNVAKTAAELASLKGPVLGHFARRDAHINEAMVTGFESAMKEAGKSLNVYWYDADHAFANPTSASYVERDAALAWERTTEFLRKMLA